MGKNSLGDSCRWFSLGSQYFEVRTNAQFLLTATLYRRRQKGELKQQLQCKLNPKNLGHILRYNIRRSKMAYFSERENGSKPATGTDISYDFWRGILGLVRQRISDGSFGSSFPDRCYKNGSGVIGTDATSFEGAAKLDNLPWPEANMPSTTELMDLIEFCHANIAQPVDGKGCYNHTHFDFDVPQGQAQFRTDVNRGFSRYGMAFELLERGEVVRLPYPILREEITFAHFNTGDKDLDELLESARTKFLDPDPAERPGSLEKLWDAWERLKSLEDASKKTSVNILLDRASKEPVFRNLLNDDAQELTDIGNKFQVRHFEKDKIAITETAHMGFLFHRLFSMIALLLRASGRM